MGQRFRDFIANMKEKEPNIVQIYTDGFKLDKGVGAAFVNTTATEDEPVPKRKRGVVNENTYKHNTIHNARVKGESYVSYSSREVPQKTKPDILTSAELTVHKRRAKKFYTSMQEASKNDDEETVDMQNLPLPNIPVQEIFYLRQLWVNVFSIHDLTTSKSKIYLYHEGEDGPSGQNKNHTVVRFLMNLSDKGQFVSITHNFAVRGHSYSPYDRDFGAIKRLLKKVDRIYTPEEYMEPILKASKTNHFNTHRVTSQHIRSFKTWWSHSYKKLTNSGKTSDRGVPEDQKESFKISTYKQFCYNKNIPGKVIVKPNVDGIIQSTFTLLKIDLAPDLTIQIAYSSEKVRV
ncbi:hypothetical protein ANN_19237 [Periplaneta americana]|uniref:DUF7869 domain-containing protein n=1 Tax=Periplaneta americana TaxID=6978 RepID=A0ABQ8S9A8_PERAM|nr:hypothetical protein ANN_19237 [Periplaneta americana]